MSKNKLLALKALNFAMPFIACWICFSLGFATYHIIVAHHTKTNNCAIPQNYCDGSIKGLEEELKIAFTKVDKCIEEKTQCEQIQSKELEKCVEKTKLWATRADQSMGMVHQCSKVVDECNMEFNKQLDELNECIVELNNCNGICDGQSCP